ncbi:helix-turn-helix domain-containing protein [Nocardia acidivorans]|uniref:helix-turn-helix domain-containing protein n=1 Tax=Nocardia acidivorans TaxID=404580 RepID=UPI0008376E4B|nr:helix-turn-helix domain-containing protein [Nocardia acidivorans]
MSKKAERASIPLNQRLALTVQEVADITGFSYPFIDRQISAGNLVACAPGGDGRSKRIRPADVDEWLQSNRWEPLSA